METAWIVKVAVSAAPYSIDKPYDYLVPAALEELAVPGARVTVPFGRGNRTSEGIILAAAPGEKNPGIKAIFAVLDREPVLDATGIALALWMRQRYFCTLYEAVKAILPAGLWYQLREVWHTVPGEEAAALAAGIPGGQAVWDALTASGGSADAQVLENACGEETQRVLRALRKAGAVTCETEAKRKLGDKMRRMVQLALSAQEALALTQPRQRSAPMQYEVVQLLSTAGKISAAELCYFTGASAATLRTM